jgi:hypothetical protein
MRPTKFRTYLLSVGTIAQVAPASPYPRRGVFTPLAPGIVVLTFVFEEARFATQEGDFGRTFVLPAGSTPFSCAIGPHEAVYAGAAGASQITVAVADVVML